MDVFRELKKAFPGVMVEFYLRCGIGKKRSMVAGNFTGVELKLLIKERSLADLSELIPNGLEVTRYLRSMRELHRMVVKKEYTPNHQAYIDNFEECFNVVRDTGLVNFTTKVHIIVHHFSYYMRETKESLYSSDTSATESTHSGLKNLQRIHNLISTHFLGTPRQQYRLKRSIMRYNWNNLPFDMREDSSENTEAPVGAGGVQEQEDISIYIQDQVVEEGEAEGGEKVSDKQVEPYLLYLPINMYYISHIRKLRI